MEMIQVGSMPVSIGTVSFFLTLGSALLVLRMINYIMQSEKDKAAFEWLFSGIFHSIWIWKFSPILFQPLESFKHPFTLLYFSGGTKGILLACVFFVGYSTRKILKQPELISPFFSQIVLMWMTGSGLYFMWKNVVGLSSNGAEVLLFLFLASLGWQLYTRGNLLIVGAMYSFLAVIVAILYGYSSTLYIMGFIICVMIYLLSLSNLNKRGSKWFQEVMKWRM
ncbi:hypothetical protein [Fictibacillus norfolkensis]|uniref:Uncharacterized protein n=1 Tax=Fictibacillus norfolkensis TaxID=2762233 RepID=A0ABR8SPK6_9BACL|nr:hypothetical protein [Fictibacillus norfolkensis]MBD7965422.1 hypothetical protein [Fictibacillus norfolkensis]